MSEQTNPQVTSIYLYNIQFFTYRTHAEEN